MPIGAAEGILEVENAKFSASEFIATTSVGIGTTSASAYPLVIFKETEPEIRIQEGETQSSGARLYSNNSNLYIQTGTDFSSGSAGDIAFQTMGGQSTHVVVKGDGKVGVGTGSPRETLDVRGAIVAPVVSYASDQNAPYLIAAGTTYDGTSTNWATEGIQHRLKSDSGGVPRVTIDTPGYGEAFCVTNDGTVGIRTTAGDRTLDVNGSFDLYFNGYVRLVSDRGTVDTSINDYSGYGSSSLRGNLGITMFNSGGGGRSWGFGCADDSTGRFALYYTGGGAPDPDINTVFQTGGYIYTKYIWVNGTQQHSDDRIKFNEEYISNATETLLKLKPQKYDKYLNLTSKDKNANVFTQESGFIAQDVYYDAPELRHIVKMSNDANPSPTKPFVPEDITEDPDYSDWGTSKASIDYIGIIPYTVRAIQEINETRGKIKTRIVDVPFSNVHQYIGHIVCNDGTLCKKYKDKTRLGVICGTVPHTTDSEVFIQQSGTGYIWVLNDGGNLESGDFITTSNIFSGFGIKQGTDILMNHTVCQITHDCNFQNVDLPSKCLKQELSNVTYYITTEYEEIDQNEWNLIQDNKRRHRQVLYYISKKDKSEINEIRYNKLSEEDKEEYTESYMKDIYEYKRIQESKYYREGAETIVREELVNVLDEHGQIQWEDDPSGATEKAYKIRYLDAGGNITDEANAVHIAAFVGCTYHCG